MLRFNSDYFKSKNTLSKSKNHKLWFLTILVIVCFFIYTVKLFSMQVISGSFYRKKSEVLSQRTNILPAQRGEIYDREADTPLVVNTDSFAVDIIPGEIPKGKYDTVTLIIADMLGMKKENIDKKIPSEVRNDYTPIEIKSNVDFKKIENIAENQNDLPGVYWRSKPLRSYVGAESLSHILGYVGDITRDELKVMYNKGYSRTSIVGKTGIEKQYDSLLHGKPGFIIRTVDVKGRYLSTEATVQSPEMGKNLVLTINSDIQKLAEKALGDRVGAVVVLKPSNGEILAMVSYPFFNPNDFNLDNGSYIYQKLNENPEKPLLNRAINATYPPASTFKVIISTAALAEENFSQTKKIQCTGKIEYGGRTFKCHNHSGHGYMDLKNGLAQSCNVYYWTVGRDFLGIDRIASYAKEFGLGQPFKIDIPGQAEGFVPTAQWKERRFHEKWLGGDTMNTSIGQGYTRVTPLQVADMMAMVVNGGKIYKPHILKEIRDPVTNEVISEEQKELLFKSNIPESVWKTVREDLRYTVENGSAQIPLRNKNIKIAGKTGTAEVAQYKDSWHSWFVCYAPYGAPAEETVVVCVLVEASNTWEWWAPYASNIIIQGIFANQNYEQAIDALGFRYRTKPIGRQE
ncbi:MAG: penicillin-binding protein 2 [Treponemataceae bacterium]